MLDFISAKAVLHVPLGRLGPLPWSKLSRRIPSCRNRSYTQKRVNVAPYTAAEICSLWSLALGQSTC